MPVIETFDWSDVATAARKLAGNWREFESFAWNRGGDLGDADRWVIWYTSHRDAGLLAQSNQQVINKRLVPFTQGDDPDLVFESHSHWAVGFVSGFSIRVFRPDGTITEAFRQFCEINERLEIHSVLDEQDYGEREFEATLENYRSEMWRHRRELPEGWEVEVYSWFSDLGHDRHIENRGDRGAWAPQEAIVETLQDMGLWPDVIVDSKGEPEP